MKELILGGARSGKSQLAQHRALLSGLTVVCIVTAEPFDTEMEERIRHHQAQRPPSWLVVEAPLHLAAALVTHAAADRVLLVDCLTLWLNNLLAGDPAQIHAEQEAFLRILPQLPGQQILVSNETGMGITPMGALTRNYVDCVGRLHQETARLCDRVTLTVAGLPLLLKGA